MKLNSWALVAICLVTGLASVNIYRHLNPPPSAAVVASEIRTEGQVPISIREDFGEVLERALDEKDPNATLEKLKPGIQELLKATEVREAQVLLARLKSGSAISKRGFGAILNAPAVWGLPIPANDKLKSQVINALLANPENRFWVEYCVYNYGRERVVFSAEELLAGFKTKNQAVQMAFARQAKREEENANRYQDNLSRRMQALGNVKFYEIIWGQAPQASKEFIRKEFESAAINSAMEALEQLRENGGLCSQMDQVYFGDILYALAVYDLDFADLGTSVEELRQISRVQFRI